MSASRLLYEATKISVSRLPGQEAFLLLADTQQGTKVSIVLTADQLEKVRQDIAFVAPQRPQQD